MGSESPVIILTNSQVKHQLSGSEYPDRVKSCREAVSVIQRKHKEVLALRDVTLEMLEEFKAVLDPVTYKRARHAVTEDTRTLDTVEALKVGDFTRVGKNMTASHVSLRDDFEVSTEELDLLVELAIAVPGVYGSRMTGGGFGGCTVTLVHKDSVDALVHRLNTAFLEKTGMTCCVYPPMTPSAGAGTLPLQDILLEKKRIIEVVDGKTGAAPHSITDIAASWAMPVAAITLAVVVAINMLRKK